MKTLLGLALALSGIAAPALADTCPFPVQDVPAQCGRIDLPADHAHPDGPARVGMFYVRVAAKAPKPGAAPVVFLSGGPGLAGSQLVLQEWPLVLGLHENHELIFVDQRGTGRSTPSLHCTKASPRAILHGVLDAADVEACLEPLRKAGYQTAWFDTAQSARDVIGLRKHLGIARWNLFGTSYGTILAQEILRRDPAGTRAVVLNSPTRASASALDTDTVAAIVAAWNQIFLDCASAPACASQAPAMRTRFLELAAKLDAKPLRATWTNPSSQEKGEAQLTPGALQALMNQIGGSGKGAVLALSAYDYLSRVVSGAVPENPAIVGALYLPPSYWQIAANVALGLNLSITCREVMPYIDLPTLRRKAAGAWPFVVASGPLSPYEIACPIWNAGKADAALNAPVTANVPVLLLTGNYDMPAPAYLAQQVAASLPDARLVSFNGTGHAVFEAEPCARELVAAFLLAGKTDVASPTCLAPGPAADFKLWKPQ